MKKIIIAIHGLGNKPEEPVLRDSWLQAIREGLALANKPHTTIPFEMVYWADISYPEPLDQSIEDPEHSLFLKEPYTKSKKNNPARKRHPIYQATLNFIENNLDRLLLRKKYMEAFPGAMDRLMKHYFSDLDTYYNEVCSKDDNQDCSAKEAIQARLQALLKKYADHEIMLISHSMGSIIAFDVLSDSSGEFHINTFVSLGSPLGLPPIVARNYQNQKRFNPLLKQPQIPEGIWPHWYNLSDRRDTVALDHTLRDDYAPNGGGLRVVDLLVSNDYEVNGELNPHKSFGYLRSAEAARIVNAFLSERSDEGFLGKCALIAGNITASTRRIVKKISTS